MHDLGSQQQVEEGLDGHGLFIDAILGDPPSSVESPEAQDPSKIEIPETEGNLRDP